MTPQEISNIKSFIIYNRSLLNKTKDQNNLLKMLVYIHCRGNDYLLLPVNEQKNIWNLMMSLMIEVKNDLEIKDFLVISE